MASAARAATAGRRRRSRRDAGRGQGGRECGLVVGPRGLEQGPDLGCFRLGIVAVRRLAIAVPGRLLPRHGRRWRGTGTALSARAPRKERPARRRPKRPRPGFLSFQRPAGRRRAKQSLSQHVFALQDCRTGRLRPGPGILFRTRRTPAGPGDFGLRAAARNATPAPVRAAGWRHRAGCVLRVAGNRISPRQRIAWIQRAQLRGGPAGCAPAGATARGPGPVAARRSPRVRPRGACRACDVPGVARASDARAPAARTRRTPAGSQAVQALALMFQALRRRHQLAGGAVEALGGPLQPPLLAARQRARRP